MPTLYAIALLIAFYALVIAEILIPTGGLLGLSATAVAVTSIIIGFTSSVSLGLTLTLIYLVTTPILFAILIQVWPRTKIGRAMLNRDTLQSDMTPPTPTTLDGTPLSDFVGRIGIATTDFLPSGQVIVDGHKSDAVSTGLPIDAQAQVIVVRVYSGKLQVRAANEQEIRESESQARAQSQNPDEPVEQVTVDAGVAEQPGDSSGASLLDDVDFDDITIDEPPPG